MGEVAQGGQDTGTGAGAGGGMVLAPEGVADPVQDLHGPVALDVLGECGG